MIPEWICLMAIVGLFGATTALILWCDDLQDDVRDLRDVTTRLHDRLDALAERSAEKIDGVIDKVDTLIEQARRPTRIIAVPSKDDDPAGDWN